jgi:RNA polymerase sigma-70 factor (ECF subfamily)
LTPDPILQQARQGDTRAFGHLVRRHQDGVFAFLWRMGLRRALIDELAQETFLRAWTHLASYDPARAAFSTWLLAICRHLALNEISRASHRLERAAADDVPDGADPADTPPDTLAHHHRRRQLHAALGQLPAAQRSVLALAYLRELSLAEVARIEGISEAAAKQRLHRARLALRQALENLP